MTSGSGERDLGLVHRIAKFKDARVVRGFLNETTTPISRNLNGQNLPNPVSSSTFQDFSANPLFSSNGPRLTDINQNQLGDCYFLATLAAVAKTNLGFLQRHVVDLGDGTYGVRFKGLFGEEYVRVDGDLPVADSAGNLPRAGFGAENSIWVAIMEKAFTFFRKNEGTYASIEGGVSGDGFDALGIGNDFSLLGFNAAALMERFRSDLAAGRAVTLSTHLTAGDSGEPIFPTHVYVVDRVNTSNGQVDSVRLYNPHGVDFGGEDSGDANPSDGFITVTPQQIMDNFISFNSAAIA